MNGCSAVQAKFTEYMDDRLNGREMQLIAAHLRDCRNCAQEWTLLRETQGALAALGPVPEPEDLLLRIRVAVSQERARSRQSIFHGWDVAWKNTVGPFLLQAGAGFASAVLLLGLQLVERRHAGGRLDPRQLVPLATLLGGIPEAVFLFDRD